MKKVRETAKYYVTVQVKDCQTIIKDVILRQKSIILQWINHMISCLQIPHVHHLILVIKSFGSSKFHLHLTVQKKNSLQNQNGSYWNDIMKILKITTKVPRSTKKSITKF